jgi:hypothetical protein
MLVNAIVVLLLLLLLVLGCGQCARVWLCIGFVLSRQCHRRVVLLLLLLLLLRLWLDALTTMKRRRR